MPEKHKKGWTRVAFGDVVQLCRDRSSKPAEEGFDRYVGLEHLEPGDLKIRRWGNVEDGTTFTNVFRAGQVLFGKRRAYQRKVAMADFDGVCSGDIYVLEPKNEHLLPGLLPFICQTDGFFAHAVGTSAGSLSPRTNWTSLASYEFALPPLEEQQRITEFFASVRNLVLALTVLHDKARQVLSSLQKRYFIDEPEGTVKEIRHIADVLNGTTPRRNRSEYWGGDIPWLPTGKVNDRHIRSSDEFITEKALDECSLSLIPRMATLVAMIGEGQTRGRAALLDIDACINQNFAAVVPREAVDPIFLFHLLESQYEALRHWSQGTNQHALNCKLVGLFQVQVPGIDRQLEIARCLQEADSVLEITALRVASAQALFKTLTEGVLAIEDYGDVQ